jgi:mono/diheme cytochrome c family protein
MNRYFIFLSLLIITLVLAACGADDGDDGADNASNAQQAVAAQEVVIPYNYDELTVQEGASNYGTYCIACHGQNAQGIAGLGPNLVANRYMARHDDDAVLQFVIEGRPADHPDNESGIAMPARAGFPNLEDEEIMTIIAYLRTLTANS